jgi:DNA-binding response OmpR family regulator
LIVEDEPLIAADLEMIVTDMGHVVVGVAETFPEVLDFMGRHPIDAAIVDVKLRDGFTGVTVAQHLMNTGTTPFFFLTGNAEVVPEDMGSKINILHKPFAETQIREAVRALDRGAAGAPCLTA